MGRQARQLGALTIATAAELSAERERQNMTLEALSDKTGIAYSTLGKILNGQSAIDTDQLWQLCEAFGMSVRTLVERAEQERNAA